MEIGKIYIRSGVFVLVLIFLVEEILSIYVPDEIEQTWKPYTTGVKIKSASYKTSSQPYYHSSYSKVHVHNKNYISSLLENSTCCNSNDNEAAATKVYPVYVSKEAQKKIEKVLKERNTNVLQKETLNNRVVYKRKINTEQAIQVYNKCPPGLTGQFVYDLACNQFLDCWNGRGGPRNCAPGTLFNPKTLECDFPDKVQCLTGPTGSSLTAPKTAKYQSYEQAKCPGDFSGLIPDYKDCSKFIQCNSGIQTRRDCPPGTLFDINLNVCNHPEKTTCFSGERGLDYKKGIHSDNEHRINSGYYEQTQKISEQYLDQNGLYGGHGVQQYNIQQGGKYSGHAGQYLDSQLSVGDQKGYYLGQGSQHSGQSTIYPNQQQGKPTYYYTQHPSSTPQVQQPSPFYGQTNHIGSGPMGSSFSYDRYHQTLQGQASESCDPTDPYCQTGGYIIMGQNIYWLPSGNQQYTGFARCNPQVEYCGTNQYTGRNPGGSVLLHQQGCNPALQDCSQNNLTFHGGPRGGQGFFGQGSIDDKGISGGLTNGTVYIQYVMCNPGVEDCSTFQQGTFMLGPSGTLCNPERQTCNRTSYIPKTTMEQPTGSSSSNSVPSSGTYYVKYVMCDTRQQDCSQYQKGIIQAAYGGDTKHGAVASHAVPGCNPQIHNCDTINYLASTRPQTSSHAQQTGIYGSPGQVCNPLYQNCGQSSVAGGQKSPGYGQTSPQTSHGIYQPQDYNSNVNYKSRCNDGDQNCQSASGSASQIKTSRGPRVDGTSPKCPEGYEGLTRHPTICKKFLNCANGITYLQECGPGTVFNPYLKVCDFPYNVDCQDDETKTTTITSDIHVGQEEQDGFDVTGTLCQGAHCSRGQRKYPSQPKQEQSNVSYRPLCQGAQCSTSQVSTPQTPTTQYVNGYGYYIPQGQGFTYQGQESSHQGKGYKPQGQWYSSTSQGQGYSPQGQGYSPQGQGYSPQGQDYSPQGQGYSPQGQGYSPQGQDYSPQGQGYDSKDQSSFPQGQSYNPSSPVTCQGNKCVLGPGYKPQVQPSSQGQYEGQTYIPPSQPSHGQGQTSYPQVPCQGWQCPTNQTHKWNISVPTPEQIPCQGHQCSQYPGQTFQGQRPIHLPDKGQIPDYEDEARTTSTERVIYVRPTQGYVRTTPTQGSVNQGYYYPTPGTTNDRNDETKHVMKIPSKKVDHKGPTPINKSDRETSGGFNNQKSVDYVDIFNPDETRNLGGFGTTQKPIGKPPRQVWPPPYPDLPVTDLNADYVFEYEDGEPVTLAPENIHVEIRKTKLKCDAKDFVCDKRSCIAKNYVCDGVRDCDDGKDEKYCKEYLDQFKAYENSRLDVLERQRWDNVSFATCALLCVDNEKFECQSFNYRKMDNTCFLTGENIGSSGALKTYYPCDYYERKSTTMECNDMHKCPNGKCLTSDQICDGYDDCGDRADEKKCRPEDFGYKVKLAGGQDDNEGRIEVTVFGKTGYICDDQFKMTDAEILCKELGFHLGAAEIKGNSYFAKDIKENNTLYMMDDIQCLGNETSLMHCNFAGWGIHNCGDNEIAGVVCKTPQETCADGFWKCDTGNECVSNSFVCDGLDDCTDNSDEAAHHCDAPTAYRLVNGTKPNEGRLEVRHFGIWGSVCDDDFNEDAAKIACRQLGYVGSAQVKKEGYYGHGSGPIWLDQVSCFGNESSLEKCSHWNWGEHNCDHSEDVGVVCSNEIDVGAERRSKGLGGISRIKIGASYTSTQPVVACGYRKDRIFLESEDVHFRVVQGSTAKPGEYPWQAALRIKGKEKSAHWCGAVVISSLWILTAAHCLEGYPKGAYVVVAGEYNIDENEGTEQQAYIEEYYLHENFRKGHKMANDIAVVKLKGTGFKLNQDIQPICLPDEDTNYETRLNCTISGFGTVQTGTSAYSHKLRAAWIPIQKMDVCKMAHIYGEAMGEGMICAGDLDGGIDACDGDSGGPLACLENGVFTLYGITSWGQRCGYANKPGVYVKISYYKKWIENIMALHS